MKINRPENKECLFGQLNAGSVFIYQNMVCIKTGYFEDTIDALAVDLEDGEVMSIPNGTRVEKVPDAELEWIL